MSKRFTDTDKWKKQFIKELPVEYKIFWLYLLDECDNAGIWHVELDLAELRLGIKLSSQKIRGLFRDRVVEFDNETKWFLPDFISFQYGELDEKNRAHKSVIDKLNKYKLLEKNKVVVSPLQGAKDKDKDKDKEKEFFRLFKNVSSYENDFLEFQVKCLLNSYPDADPRKSAGLVNSWAGRIKEKDYQAWKANIVKPVRTITQEEHDAYVFGDS